MGDSAARSGWERRAVQGDLVKKRKVRRRCRPEWDNGKVRNRGEKDGDNPCARGPLLVSSRGGKHAGIFRFQGFLSLAFGMGNPLDKNRDLTYNEDNDLV